MKAWVLHGINEFGLETVDKPVQGDGEVLVRVEAAGICGSDIPRVFRTGTYSYPLIPGHEFAGVVEETGAGADAKWLRKRVGVFPLIPCGKCVPCQRGQYEMCQHYNYLGSRTDGGFAEYVRVPVWNLLELPDKVTMEQAAMLEPMAVAAHAIRRSKAGTEGKIAVCGLGTIGLLVVMLLREMGCENIYCIGNKEFQKERVQALGLPQEQYCDIGNTDVEDWITDQTDGNGVDVFFECVGKNETLLQSINCAAAGGTVQLVGNPASDMSIEKSVYWKILRRQLSVYGSWNSSFTHSEDDDWHYVLDRLKTGKIRPEQMITHRYSLEEMRDGFELMRDKREDYIKIIGSSL